MKQKAEHLVGLSLYYQKKVKKSDTFYPEVQKVPAN
jgi:hypothetical protein